LCHSKCLPGNGHRSRTLAGAGIGSYGESIVYTDDTGEIVGCCALQFCWEYLAIKQFISALDITINDGPSKTMLARCNEYKINPPEKDWNGAYTIKTK